MISNKHNHIIKDFLRTGKNQFFKNINETYVKTKNRFIKPVILSIDINSYD